MDAVFRPVIISLLCFTPIAVSFLFIRSKLRSLRERSKLPFQELPRRPSGESLRLKLQDFDARVLDCLLALVGVPAVLAITGNGVRFGGIVFLTLIFLFSATWVLFFARKFFSLIRERAGYQLGFEGERYVAETIAPLMESGFQIFHDVPFEEFNIDHVLVGSPGVFSVETKTRRKPVKEGNKQYHVTFDGSCLCWPWGRDTGGLKQAEDNARTLSRFLSGAVGEHVSVTAILTVPGWMIERMGPCSGVHVLNPKEIIGFCSREKQKLNGTLLKRISYQLEQKCKLEV